MMVSTLGFGLITLAPLCLSLLQAPLTFRAHNTCINLLNQPERTLRPAFCNLVLQAQNGQQQQQQQRPANEFSRVFDTESILTTNNREYKVNIAATADEMLALCKRFDLPEISLLSADLSIRKHSSTATRRGTSAALGLSVAVLGNVQSQLKQTCVRTGQTFDVDLSFPLQAVVRPMIAASASSSSSESFAEDQSDSRQRRQRYSQRQQQPQQQQQRTSIEDVNMMELQRLLQEIDVTDDVFEDDAIYDVLSKQLDVGELVAQCFCLQLDPYPKKPGTDPIFISISG